MKLALAEGVRPDVAEDGASFVVLVEPVLPAAFRLAFGILGSEADAEDAVQEAVLNAWRHFNRFRRGAELRPWLLKIVANECRSQLRGRWRKVLKLGATPTPGTDTPGPDPLGLDLRRALMRLPADLRLVLLLRYYLDLPFDEIGATLGISAPAAKSRTHRALRRLRVFPEVSFDD